jgi:DNA polymerase-3 subunit delta'
MFNISADIEELYIWKEFEREIAEGNFSHALAIRSLESKHFELVTKIGRLLLGDLGWVEDRHPDLLFAGENSVNNQKPPSIEECREFMNDISLKPVISNRRLGVIMFADRLLLPSANSLLKITEEPPSHVNLLFMMQSNTLLPTLRSRVRFISVLNNSCMESNKIPDNDFEWLEWGKNAKEITDIAASLEKWSNYATENGDAELAFKIEKVRLLIDAGKLSKSIAQDLILLALKEELAVEHLFGSIW